MTVVKGSFAWIGHELGSQKWSSLMRMKFKIADLTVRLCLILNHSRMRFRSNLSVRSFAAVFV